MCHMISEATVPSDTLIVVGQRPLDCSQIVDGAFYDALPQPRRTFMQSLRAPPLLLKPHPLEPDATVCWRSRPARRTWRAWCRDNIYRLMSLPQITAVLTVNSSIAYEAPYFGKHVHTLAPLPIRLGWRGAADGSNLYASLNDQVLSVDFWRRVLAPHMPVSEPDGMRLPPKPNRLRIALDSFWNFQEIDTDRIPGRPGS